MENAFPKGSGSLYAQLTPVKPLAYLPCFCYFAASKLYGAKF
jgi:hypothetical protein